MIFVLRFLNTMWPPMATRSQSAAEGEAGGPGRREQRQRGFPGPAETRREAQAASQAPAAGGLSWPDPEGGVYSFRRTNPEIRRGHVRQTRSRDDRHRRRGLCVYPCPSNVRCRDRRRDPCRAVFICKNCISWNHKKSKNDDRKPFTIFQEFPPR